MKKSIFFSFGLLLSSMAFGQTTTENYIKNITYRKAFTDATKSTATNVDKIEAVAYYDGLGRPKQNIAIRAGGQSQDVITTFAYDAFGRQAKEYLPYALASNNGVFRTDALTATGTFYNTTKYENTTNPFSEKAFEASPLNRVLKQAAPGYDWRMGGGKEIKVDYLVNAVSDNVEWFGVSLVLANNTYTPTLTTKGNYALGELIKVITKDENYISGVDRSTEVFTDKYGRIILERKHNNGTHDTYYVYDDYGNLTYVLSPKMDASNATLAVIIGKMNDLGHQYIYDHKNRIVESKIPGKGWGYIVYNKRNQPILSQDELLKSQSRWLFMLYDIYGRVAFTGLDTGNSSTRITLQTAADAAAKTFVTRTTAGNTYAGTVVYYSNDAYPTSYDEIHGVNYYDSYIDSDGLSVPTTVYSQAKATNTKGLATVSKLRVLDSSPVMWETSISGYDNYGRMMYAANKNNYFTITDIAESKLDFLGNIEETKNTHTKNTTSLITIDKNTYDHMGRITKQTQTLGTHVEVIAQNTYDELGQLKQTKVGNTEITPLQTVDYDYNVRGWLKNINDVSNIGTDLFAFKIGYNTPSGGTPLYNGNISQITWKTLNVDQSTKFYTYSYDALNRITAAIDNTSKFDLSSVAYDKNGNITSLLRKGSVVANPLLSNAANYGVMDNLTFTYDAGNKLTILSDIGSDTEGARDDQIGTSPDSTPDYAYDVNGNMTSDLNKGILANGITYNHFNLPKQVTLSGGTIKYVYNALGIKLRKIVTPGVTTDYAGNYLYENGVLKFFNHPQGYVEVESGLYKYVYQYKDHLDNVRLSYSDTNGNGSIVLSEIREENNYYPFGLKHKGYNNGINGRDHKFEYNNTELEKVFGYDIMEMTFRQYDPAIARFTTIDPVVHHSQSTYASFDNNPVFWADPSGADSDSGGFGLGRSGRLADNVQIFNFGMTADEVSRMENGIPKTNTYQNYNSISDSEWNKITENTILLPEVEVIYKDNNSYRAAAAIIANNIYASSGWGNYNSSSSNSVGQPGTWESMIPVWGSGRAAVDHFQNGNYWRGAGYTALAISDVFLVKSIATAASKGAWKLGAHSWGATRSWLGKNGYAKAGQPVHHWAVSQATAKKYGLESLTNQPWNLKTFANQSMHMRAGHGYNYLGQPGFGTAGQLWYGTPTWPKAVIVSYGGRGSIGIED